MRSYTPTEPQDSGDCFTAALNVLEAAVEIGAPKLRLVHGTPVGRGLENRGRRYWHAWVEADTPKGWVVIDASNGHRLGLPRDSYYRAGQLTESHVWRYTPAVARRMVDQLGHGGPWVPDADAKVDV